jgi:hypothetical protein
MMLCACHASYTGSINRRSVVQRARQRHKILFKEITKGERAGSMAQIVEHLPSKHKVLISNPSTAKKKKKKVH